MYVIAAPIRSETHEAYGIRTGLVDWSEYTSRLGLLILLFSKQDCEETYSGNEGWSQKHV